MSSEVRDWDALLKEIKKAVREAIEESKREDVAKLGSAMERMVDVMNKMLEILERHSKMLEEHSKILKEHSEILREHSEMLKRHSEILEEHTKLLKSHDRRLTELEILVGSTTRRWGKDLERAVIALYRDNLAQLGIDPNRIRGFTYDDVDGRYGPRGVRYEFDVVIDGDGVTVVEVKSRAERDDVEWFYDKVSRVRPVIGNVKRLVLVTVVIDKEALDRARELGIDVIYGTVIE